MLSESHLECPLRLPDVDLMAFFTWNLVDHSSLPLLRNAGLESHQGLSDASQHSANNSFQFNNIQSSSWIVSGCYLRNALTVRIFSL